MHIHYTLYTDNSRLSEVGSDEGLQTGTLGKGAYKCKVYSIYGVCIVYTHCIHFILASLHTYTYYSILTDTIYTYVYTHATYIYIYIYSGHVPLSGATTLYSGATRHTSVR